MLTIQEFNLHLYIQYNNIYINIYIYGITLTQ